MSAPHSNSAEPKHRISLVVAMAENRVIGRDNQLPWHLPADLAYFKRLTTGHAVIMGRKTFDSIRRPLPNRTNIVITRQPNWTAPGVVVAHDLDEALQIAGSRDEVFIVGGAEIFRLAMPRAGRIYLTLVHADIGGDTRFPQIDEPRWRLIGDEFHEPDARNPHAYSFRVYERR